MQLTLQALINQTVHDLYQTEVTVELTRPEAQFGDYATNIALQLAKPVGKNPRLIADEIVQKLHETAKNVREITIAGPGFINITVTDEALVQIIQTPIVQSLQGKIVIAEYSDPNPFKPLHAGHLYTTLVGDVIARLQEAGGATVTRISYGGDVGLHVGKSMWGIIKFLEGEHPDKLADILENERPAWMGARYVEGNNAYEEDETSKAEIVAINKRVYEVHSQNDHKSTFAQLYWTCREWSYNYFQVLYKELQVHPFDRVIPESEVTPLGLQIVKEQLAKGVYQESEGAIIFKGEDFGLHTRVFINSQGLPTYEAKDVGLMLTKWNDYHYDTSLYIVASEQDQYMKVMFKSIEQFLPEAAQRVRHLSHGMVKLTGGAKMSSRKGNIVTALDVLDAATIAAKEQNPTSTHETVLAAVKYAFLKNRVGGDIIYDPKDSVSLEGNSGPYLQYAHARARSILRKHEGQILGISVINFEPAERVLVRKITEYSEVVEKSISEYMPHYICTYLYELSQEFNRFYERSRVIGDEREAIRLSLVQTYADTLQNGLSLLGVHAQESM